MLSVDFALVNKANEGETFVDFTKVEHDVFLVIGVGQSDNWGGLLVEFWAILLVITVDASHINEHINQFWADLIVLHVDRSWVGCDVDFRNYIEEESFLNLAARDQSVHHLGNEGHLG